MDVLRKEPSPFTSAEPQSAIRNPQSAIRMEVHPEGKANDSPADKAAPQEYSDKSTGRAVPMDSSRKPDQRSGSEENRIELRRAVSSSEGNKGAEKLEGERGRGGVPPSPTPPLTPSGRGEEVYRDRLEVVDQIVRHVVTSVRKGRSEMHILLEPEHLGTLRLKLFLDESTVIVRLQVESESTKELIESHLPKLRASLEEQGLTVEKFDVLVEHGAPDSSDRQEAPLYRERASAPYDRGPKNGLGKPEETDVGLHRSHRSFGYNTMEWTA